MSEGLPMWTVYDHPTDYPNEFVARKSIVTNVVYMTDELLRQDDLEELRKDLAGRGLICMQRSPEDDAKIVEVWL